MVIKYGMLGNLLANFMYKDKLTAIRGKQTRNPDGSMGSEFLDSFLQDEPCLVQETVNDSSRDDNLDVARQELTVTIYCGTNCNILRGDVLKLSVMDDNNNVKKVIVGNAGQPSYFPDHLEIDLYDWRVS